MNHTTPIRSQPIKTRMAPIALNVQDSADFLGVSRSTFLRMEARGLITPLKLERRKLFSVKKLTALVDG